MNYTIEISSLATRQIKKLPSETQIQVLATLAALAQKPRPDGVTKMKGEDNTYRLRVKNYRIVYEILDEQLIVLIVKVGHRREVYRN
ncbi:type II toxin-antitoxin system RelE family toxin [Limnofasciculus baicalensis]|uniref:Type II toxin-antitoxin system RelE/ParE family toxin n=1 Tax=Limnofasciculus baicalensis BBK-W-15 TaxID=2699891 RepID=A0AAE3GMR7_9CYAN|nr:type II toxin-antitoxin system RelE/ParE family toxin [Limnofasciculus baicalensis]MCP2727465.1 type II toxin-antitoxin system RelE/ParE family toxin [Limnofasciculus baicalensis BBK-W-15]